MTIRNNAQSEKRQTLKLLMGAGAMLPCAAALANSSAPTAIPGSQAIPDKHFHSRIDQIIEQSTASPVRVEHFTITPSDLPWSQTLGEVEKGQQVTFLLTGRWWIVKAMDLWAEPGVAFFSRVSDGELFNPMQNTGTMRIEKSGTLEIARSVGEFTDDHGNLFTPLEHYTAAEGIIEGVALIWQDDPLDQMTRLSATADIEGLIGAERNRLNNQQDLPEGWKYMYMFGDGGIFTQKQPGHLHCDTHKNVGILQYDTSVAMSPNLELSWQWVVEQLPAEVAEDQALNHDYLSIAVEFDDGKDITYMWSSVLPVGQVFQCPLPRWNTIETHVVQRSGQEELGKNLQEQRNIYQDYQNYIGGDASKVTRIWLIANSVFKRSSGKCSYSDIALVEQDKRIQIL